MRTASRLPASDSASVLPPANGQLRGKEGYKLADLPTDLTLARDVARGRFGNGTRAGQRKEVAETIQG